MVVSFIGGVRWSCLSGVDYLYSLSTKLLKSAFGTRESGLYRGVSLVSHGQTTWLKCLSIMPKGVATRDYKGVITSDLNHSVCRLKKKNCTILFPQGRDK